MDKKKPAAKSKAAGKKVKQPKQSQKTKCKSVSSRPARKAVKVKPPKSTMARAMNRPSPVAKKEKVSVAVGASQKEEFPHFRRYKKNNHPALVTGEHSEKEYNFRKVTHNEKDGRHLNEKVYPNPNPKDPKPMYIGKRERHDEKNKFGEKLPWKYPKKDKEKK